MWSRLFFSRALLSCGLAGLLAACSSTPPQPTPATPPIPPVATPLKTSSQLQDPPDQGPLPVYQRELSGVLIGAPAGTQIDMALLAIDERARPQQSLGIVRLNANGAPLPFHLRFNPDAFPRGMRVELRARVIQSGQLSMHLPAQTISQPTTQNLGNLNFQAVP